MTMGGDWKACRNLSQYTGRWMVVYYLMVMPSRNPRVTDKNVQAVSRRFGGTKDFTPQCPPGMCRYGQGDLFSIYLIAYQRGQMLKCFYADLVNIKDALRDNCLSFYMNWNTNIDLLIFSFCKLVIVAGKGERVLSSLSQQSPKRQVLSPSPGYVDHSLTDILKDNL